jgi:CDP-glycerol glycerophosphotransferase (TagB/SpsB family)
VLLREATLHERIGAVLPPSAQTLLDDPMTRCVLVAPTWKRGQGQFTSTAAFHDRLAAWAAATNTVVFIKAHPFMTGAQTPATIPGRLQVIDASVDIYPSLSRFDALITDHSSIMFDFLLTGKPIFTYEAAIQAHAFEPDWTLVPDTPFRYAFDETSMESVLTANMTVHPLSASQAVLASQLYETDPLTASADLLRVIEACHAAALDRPVDVVELESANATDDALAMVG